MKNENSKELLLVKTLIRPAQSGSTDLNQLFPGQKKKIDAYFREFVSNNSGYYNFEEEPQKYQFFKTEPGTNSDSFILERKELFSNNDRISGPCEIVANLQFLSQNFEEFLSIPKGQEEVNFIVGYAHKFSENKNNVGHSKLYVFFVEHEFEQHGVNEIHFHARPIDSWGDDCPIGMYRVK